MRSRDSIRQRLIRNALRVIARRFQIGSNWKMRHMAGEDIIQRRVENDEEWRIEERKKENEW